MGMDRVELVLTRVRFWVRLGLVSEQFERQRACGIPMASKGTASKACFTKAFSPRCRAMLTASPYS